MTTGITLCISASELRRLAGETFRAGITPAAAGGRTLRALKRAFRGADTHVLRDLGLDRDAC